MIDKTLIHENESKSHIFLVEIICRELEMLTICDEYIMVRNFHNTVMLWCCLHFKCSDADL